jgi:hypothetical protein
LLLHQLCVFTKEENQKKKKKKKKTVREMKKNQEVICPICLMSLGKRTCPLVHHRICPVCCGQTRSTRNCSQEYCTHGYEKIWLEETRHGLREQKIYWSPTTEDIEAELTGELIAWCYRPIPALDGKRPIDVSKSAEGKKKILALLQSAENKGKTLKGPHWQPIDYTIIKKKLGLL